MTYVVSNHSSHPAVPVAHPDQLQDAAASKTGLRQRMRYLRQPLYLSQRRIPKGTGKQGPKSCRQMTAAYNFDGTRKFITKVVPNPNLLSTSIVPLCASMIAFASGRPRPMPCVSLEKRLR